MGCAAGAELGAMMRLPRRLARGCVDAAAAVAADMPDRASPPFVEAAPTARAATAALLGVRATRRVRWMLELALFSLSDDETGPTVAPTGADDPAAVSGEGTCLVACDLGACPPERVRGASYGRGGRRRAWEPPLPPSVECPDARELRGLRARGGAVGRGSGGGSGGGVVDASRASPEAPRGRGDEGPLSKESASRESAVTATARPTWAGRSATAETASRSRRRRCGVRTRAAFDGWAPTAPESEGPRCGNGVAPACSSPCPASLSATSSTLLWFTPSLSPESSRSRSPPSLVPALGSSRRRRRRRRHGT